jgi:hypothetical protein
MHQLSNLEAELIELKCAETEKLIAPIEKVNEAKDIRYEKAEPLVKKVAEELGYPTTATRWIHDFLMDGITRDAKKGFLSWLSDQGARVEASLELVDRIKDIHQSVHASADHMHARWRVQQRAQGKAVSRNAKMPPLDEVAHIETCKQLAFEIVSAKTSAERSAYSSVRIYTLWRGGDDRGVHVKPRIN